MKVVCKEQNRQADCNECTYNTLCPESTIMPDDDTPKQDAQITWEEHLEREAEVVRAWEQSMKRKAEIAEQFAWEAFKLTTTKADEAVKATKAAKIRELKAFHNKARAWKAWITAAKLKDLQEEIKLESVSWS